MTHSRVFGEVEALTNRESDLLKDFVKRAPHIVFDLLNREMNNKGLCLMLTTPELPAQKEPGC